ncbi:MAG: PP0621 family protein [Tepidimonas sp.]|uniref:PP0621 family protein n=1 Tax=Tepidimonas sp. TaxID=2002775 RepID=UPI00298EE7F0|nr:PP0621 family protein [Tepidimonas sp.]MCS6811163.1 PP0621 family protein [Tepidimonas sp.]MDW8335773.1 PP0621 family protein [Tepidimonas sp.]
MQPMLKWLLVITVLALGWAWWRQQRRLRGRPPHPPQPAAPPSPQAMLRCRHCGVHVPASEATRGALGPYCCDEHRRLAEG